MLYNRTIVKVSHNYDCTPQNSFISNDRFSYGMYIFYVIVTTYLRMRLLTYICNYISPNVRLSGNCDLHISDYTFKNVILYLKIKAVSRNWIQCDLVSHNCVDIFQD